MNWYIPGNGAACTTIRKRSIRIPPMIPATIARPASRPAKGSAAAVAG
jgi:hypothetical protein